MLHRAELPTPSSPVSHSFATPRVLSGAHQQRVITSNSGTDVVALDPQIVVEQAARAAAAAQTAVKAAQQAASHAEIMELQLKQKQEVRSAFEQK